MNLTYASPSTIAIWFIHCHMHMRSAGFYYMEVKGSHSKYPHYGVYNLQESLEWTFWEWSGMGWPEFTSQRIFLNQISQISLKLGRAPSDSMGKQKGVLSYIAMHGCEGQSKNQNEKRGSGDRSAEQWYTPPLETIIYRLRMELSW